MSRTRSFAERALIVVIGLSLVIGPGLAALYTDTRQDAIQEVVDRLDKTGTGFAARNFARVEREIDRLRAYVQTLEQRVLNLETRLVQLQGG